MQETIYRINTPVSIALITDFHETSPEPILASLRARHPEIICIAGDMVLNPEPERGTLTAERIAPMLRECCAIAPVFMSLGNHESRLYPEDLRLLHSTGTHILDNSWEEWNGIQIGGLTSAAVTGWRQYRTSLAERSGRTTRCTEKNAEPPNSWKKAEPQIPGVKAEPQNSWKRAEPRIPWDKTEPQITWLKSFCQQTRYKILLCHHPEYYPKYLADLPIDLVLSGHAHGGQWRFFRQGIFAPGQGWFPRLTSGIYDRLVVSRGLANTAPFPRIFNPKELVYLLPLVQD